MSNRSKRSHSLDFDSARFSNVCSDLDCPVCFICSQPDLLTSMATITVQAPVKEEIQSLGAYKEFAAGPGKYQQAAEEEGEGKATVRMSYS